MANIFVKAGVLTDLMLSNVCNVLSTLPREGWEMIRNSKISIILPDSCQYTALTFRLQNMYSLGQDT